MPATLDQMIERVAGRLGMSQSGTATAGSATTLTDTLSLIQPDNQWQLYYLRMTSGANAGAERLITAHNQAAKTLTVDPAFNNPVALGDAYQIKSLQHAEFVRAIQTAIASAGDRFMQVVDDPTTLTFTTEQEYALPADLIMLNNVFAGWGNRWLEISSWRVLGAPGAYKLHIGSPPDWPYFAVTIPLGTLAQMRLIYTKMPTTLSAGGDSLGVGGASEGLATTYMEEYALAVINQSLMSRNATGEKARVHMSLAEQHRAEAERIKNTWVNRPTARSVQVRPWAKTIY
jgi:hypothetical protein